MRRRLAATAAVLSLAAVPVAGCGSSNDDAQKSPAPPRTSPVVRSAAATKAAGSAKVAFHGTVGAGGQRVAISGGGAVDFKASRARLNVGTRLPAAGTVSVDQLVDGRMLYVRAPRLFSLLPGGKQWLKVDLTRASGGKADLGALRQLTAGSDPGRLVAWLAVAGNARSVGRESVRGVPTTHYKAHIDVNQVARSADPDVRRSLQQLGVRSVPVDAWLDDQGLVRRLHIAAGTDGTRVPMALDLTFDFSDFGTAVNATPPAADHTLDVTSTAAAALRLLG
jgi:hypothetical protein